MHGLIISISRNFKKEKKAIDFQYDYEINCKLQKFLTDQNINAVISRFVRIFVIQFYFVLEKSTIKFDQKQ